MRRLAIAAIVFSLMLGAIGVERALAETLTCRGGAMTGVGLDAGQGSTYHNGAGLIEFTFKKTTKPVSALAEGECTLGGQPWGRGAPDCVNGTLNHLHVGFTTTGSKEVITSLYSNDPKGSVVNKIWATNTFTINVAKLGNCYQIR